MNELILSASPAKIRKVFCFILIMSADTVDMTSETVDLEVQSSDLLVSIFLIFSINHYCKSVFL